MNEDRIKKLQEKWRVEDEIERREKAKARIKKGQKPKKKEVVLFKRSLDEERNLWGMKREKKGNSRLTYAYRKWRKKVLKEANHKCEICGELAIDVHHIIPVCVRPDKIFDVENGMALCLKCHREKHPELPASFFARRWGQKTYG